MRRVRSTFLVAIALVATATACDAILDFGQFDFSATDGGTAKDGAPGDATTEASSGGPGVPDGGSCNVDLTQVCYPCDPSSTDQYLNSCNSGITQCLAFDQTRVAPFLVDGGLPPVPEGGLQQ